jgi:hypothetical protein
MGSTRDGIGSYLSFDIYELPMLNQSNLEDARAWVWHPNSPSSSEEDVKRAGLDEVEVQREGRDGETCSNEETKLAQANTL